MTFAASAIVRYKGVRKITETKRVVNRFLITAYYVVIAKGRIEIVLTGFGHPHELNRDLVQLARILATRATALDPTDESSGVRVSANVPRHSTHSASVECPHQPSVWSGTS